MRNGRVNSKTLGQIMAELSEPLDPALFKTSFNGTSYLPVEVYEGRFNKVVGRENYDIQFPELKIVEMGKDVKVMALCRLLIYEEGGEVCSETSRWGAANLLVSNNGSEEKINTTVQQAQSYALVAVIKTFGVGMEQVRAAKKEKESGKIPENPRAERVQSEGPGETGTYDIKLISAPSSKGQRFFANCEDMLTGERYELVMKSINLQTAAAQINKNAAVFLQACRPGVKLRIRAYTADFAGKRQLNFVGFPIGGES